MWHSPGVTESDVYDVHVQEKLTLVCLELESRGYEQVGHRPSQEWGPAYADVYANDLRPVTIHCDLVRHLEVSRVVLACIGDWNPT